MCVYAFKKESSERETSREDREGKEQCSLLCSLQSGDLGGKAAKRTSDKSGYQWQQHWKARVWPPIFSFSQSANLSYLHVFFFIAFPSSFPPTWILTTLSTSKPSLPPLPCQPLCQVWGRLLELWGHSTPATIRHLLASTAKSWMLDTVQGERVIVREDVGEAGVERSGTWENEQTIQGRREVEEQQTCGNNLAKPDYIWN